MTVQLSFTTGWMNGRCRNDARIYQSMAEIIERESWGKAMTTKNSVVPPAPFYKGIPRVRWMYPGDAYKARMITVPRHIDQAIMFIYVLDSKYVIAFRDEAMTNELGMLKLEHFEKIARLQIDVAPAYTSVCPISLTYGQLLQVVEPMQVKVVPEPAKEVAVMDLPEEYGQLTLF